MRRAGVNISLAATSRNSHASEPVRGELFIDDRKVTNDGTDGGGNACRESSKKAN